MNPDKGGNTAFEVHEYAGLTAFALVLGFWIFSLIRQRGTPPSRVAALDVSPIAAPHFGPIFVRILQLSPPSNFLPTKASSPLASAIHGLGLLLMTAMAASGTVVSFCQYRAIQTQADWSAQRCWFTRTLPISSGPI